MRSGLAEIVRPMKVDQFLADFYGRQYRHFEGPHQRFAELLPWPLLNAILRQHRLEFPRLRLALDGNTIPVDSYAATIQTRRGVAVQKLQVDSFQEHLRNGATLVLDAVDELVDSIGELTANLEHELREGLQVNAYVSWGTTHGFDLHWDDHDVFVLQVAGRKRWQIYGPTRRWPMFRDIEPNTEPPAEPIAEHIIESGDVLYVPRGWWHVATAINEPSLHLTFGVTLDTGIDLVSWLADELRADERFRQDLPRFATQQDRLAHSQMLKEALLQAWTPDILEHFFADQDANSSLRPSFSLPWAATKSILPPDDDSTVRLLASRVHLESNNGVVDLHANGQKLSFAHPAAPLLRALASGESKSIRELCALPDSNLNRDVVRTLLGELCQQGLLAAT